MSNDEADSLREQEIAEAQAEVSSCQEEYDSAYADFEEAQEELEQATKDYENAKKRNEELRKWEQRLKRLREEMEARHQSIRHMEAAVAAGEAKLKAAYEALKNYLDGSPAAREAKTWLEYQPKAGQLVTPDVLNKRLNPSHGALLEIARYIRDTDLAVNRSVTTLAAKIRGAKLPMERAMASRQISTTLSGRLAEELAIRALGCYGSAVSTQERKNLENGHYTKVDLVVKNLSSPLLLGRGEGMLAPIGGSLALEVKCGRKEYLRQQLEHMSTQAAGHQSFSSSFTLCSRDIHDLGDKVVKHMRARLRNEGSPLIAQLPYKWEMDDICHKIVQEKVIELYGEE